MGIYMGPIWATHKELVRALQHGSMLDPYGQSHIGTIWVQYGKKPTHIYLPGEKNKTKKKQKKNKKKLIHIFTQMTIVPSPSPFDGLVRSQQRETSVHVEVIAHAYNPDALKI